jgi:two-component system OmpR family sensor kinase
VKLRASLAQRISGLAVLIAIITAVVAGVLSVSLIRNVSESSARSTLAKLASASETITDNAAKPRSGQTRAVDTLHVLKVRTAHLNKGILVGDVLARDSLSAADIATLEKVRTLSLKRRVDGREVYIEARATSAGAIVLVQPRSDALADVDRALRRVLIALLIAVGIAIVLGLYVGYRIARPLRRTAQAAHAMADGHRDVAVPEDGPAEVAEVAAAVNSLAAGLQRSEARQRDFLLSVSHELRTPLTAITGYAESLADGVIAADEAAGAGQVIVDEARRLNRLVADLLDLARLGAQDFRLDVVTADLVLLATDAGRVWTGRCEAAGLPFVLELPAVAVWVNTDPARIRQVVDGLLENALRVTPLGRPLVLAVRVEAAVAIIEVRDGGPGLADEDLAVAFQQSVLYQKYRSVRRVGTGLGLAIVEGLVVRLGGQIEAGHASEGGARFTLRLPVAYFF